jgi:hypothetical protein
MAGSTINFQRGTTYSFRPYSAVAGVLGEDFSNATVMAVLDRETAQVVGVDTFALYAQLLPYLPAGTSKSASDTDWVRFRLNSGLDTVIPSVCINPDTVVVSVVGKVTIVVNQVNPSDIPQIKQALISNGFDKIDVIS